MPDYLPQQPPIVSHAALYRLGPDATDWPGGAPRPEPGAAPDTSGESGGAAARVILTPCSLRAAAGSFLAMIFLILVLLGAVVLARTRWGYETFATGGNELAASYAG